MEIFVQNNVVKIFSQLTLLFALRGWNITLSDLKQFRMHFPVGFVWLYIPVAQLEPKIWQNKNHKEKK